MARKNSMIEYMNEMEEIFNSKEYRKSLEKLHEKFHNEANRTESIVVSMRGDM